MRYVGGLLPALVWLPAWFAVYVLLICGASVIGSRDAAVHDFVVTTGLDLEPGSGHPEQDLIADLLETVRWAPGDDDPGVSEDETRGFRRINVPEY